MDKTFLRLARVATVLALFVVTIGAWVRLTDAGLGCPDWPGCYGQLVVSEDLSADPSIGNEFGRAVDTGKAWREMIHRYLASTLGLLVVALTVIAWRKRRLDGQPWRVPLVLLGLVIFQGLLGMWTVTLLLKPVIVVAHLLGGLSTLALLYWLARGASAPPRPIAPGLRRVGFVAAAVLVVQIALGGWTSANYAAVACPDFPTCQTQWWPAIADFREAFVLWRGLGVDYEGGVLDHPARVAIHFTHRLGAVLATAFLIAFGAGLLRTPAARGAGQALLAALALQVALGVSIVLWGVPLAVAVAHNGVAALLLLTVINAHERLRQR